MVRDQVLISYVPKDRRWAKQLRLHLRPLELRGQLRCWEHADMAPGSKVDDIRRAAIDRTRVAVLILSAEYLAEQHPDQGELATLLVLAASNEVTVLTVYARACTAPPKLALYSAVNSPDMALARLSLDERDKLFAVLSTQVDGLLRPLQPPPPMQPPKIAYPATEAKADRASTEQASAMLSNPETLLKQLRVRRWVQDLPRGLVRELAEFFDEISEVKRIVREAKALIQEHCPQDTALPLSHVPLGAGARIAWEAATLEAAKVSPRALMSLLLSARANTATQLPITEQTILYLFNLPS